MISIEPSNVVGFTKWMDFMKAAGTLLLFVGGTVAVAGDKRYAPISLVDKVDELQVSVEEVRAEQLLQTLFDMQVKNCAATSAESKQFFAKRIQDLKTKYNALKHEPAFVPSCEDLM